MPAHRLLSTSIILILAGTFLCIPTLLAQVTTPEAPDLRGEVYAVAPTRSGDKELRVDIYRPQGRPGKGAVLLVHGGAFVTGARDVAENQAYGKALAAHGYLAAAMSYRLLGDEPVVDGWAATYAQTVRQSPDPRVQAGTAQYGADFPDAVAASGEDVVAAIRWLRGHATEFGFDADNVAVFGASAGAISALTVAYAMDDYGAEPVDLAAVISLRGLLLPPGASSPLERRDPSLLIVHGEADERVPVSYADSLFRSAQKAGVYVEFYSAPGFGHELGGSALLNLYTHVDETVLDRMDAFLSSAFDDERRIVPSVRGLLVSTGAPSGGPGGSTVRSEIRAAVGALIEVVNEEAGFVESLYGLSRRDLLVHDFDDPQREDWSYWPRTRAGLPASSLPPTAPSPLAPHARRTAASLHDGTTAHADPGYSRYPPQRQRVPPGQPRDDA